MLLRLITANIFFFLCVTLAIAQDPDPKPDSPINIELDIDEANIIHLIRTGAKSISLPIQGKERLFTYESTKYYSGDTNPTPGLSTYNLEEKEGSIQGRLIISQEGIAGIFMSNTSKVSTLFHDNYNNPGPTKYYEQLGLNNNNTKERPSCGWDQGDSHIPFPKELKSQSDELLQKKFGTDKKVFRAAIICTGHYTEKWGGSSNTSRAKAMEHLVQFSFIFERELNIKFVMATNAPYAYTNGLTDPFGPAQPGGQRCRQAGDDIDRRFPNDNLWDAGNVFTAHIDGEEWCDDDGACGGQACGRLCGSGKGNAFSGSFFQDHAPNQFIGTAVHEFAHNITASHTWNTLTGSCSMDQYQAGSAYEIGSGVTLMSYGGVGICGDDENALKNNEGDATTEYNFFHSHNLEQMIEHLESSVVEGCNVSEWEIGINQEPIVDANPCGATFTIPKRTPFFLRGSATDPDGDEMTYVWEQFDANGSTVGNIGNAAANNTAGPLFRNYPPSTNPVRHLPRKSTQLSGENDVLEVLPSRGRNISMRFLVRDNNPAGGAIQWDQVRMEC